MGRIKWQRADEAKRKRRVDDKSLGSRLAHHIGTKLLELRQERQMPMREVAAGTGISKAFVCQVENGLCVPSCVTLWRMSEFFGVEPQYWFDGFEASHHGQ